MPAFTGFSFDRALFFQHFRAQFGDIPAHKQYVVDGLNRLLTGFETYFGWWDDLRQIANAFAQVGWETAFSYTPVVEAYYLGDATKPGFFQGNTSRVLAVQKTFWYWPHIGRGDIQCTHLENYQKADAYIRKYFPERVEDFEQTGKRFDLVKDPAQMFDGWISFCTFTVGMHLGTFRKGHTLDRYINPVECDHYAAREIVNGDKSKGKPGQKLSIGRQIERIAKRFEIVLNASMTAFPGGISTATDDELHFFADQLGEAPTEQTGAAEPNVLDLKDPVLSSVEPGAGARPDDAPASPVGDAPDVKPSFFLRVEDYKNFVLRWLKRIWVGGIFGNISQATAFVGAAINDPARGHIYIGIGAVLFVIIAVAGLALSAGLGILLWWNRKEIGGYISAQWAAQMDPTQKNYGLTFVDK